MKQFEKIKQQLRELSEPINSFTSEAVQLMVIDWVLDHLEHWNKKNHDTEPPAIDPEIVQDNSPATGYQDLDSTQSLSETGHS